MLINNNKYLIFTIKKNLFIYKKVNNKEEKRKTNTYTHTKYNNISKYL